MPEEKVRPPRYAIYFTPEPGTALHRFGSAWLGYDAAEGRDCAQPQLAGIPAERLWEITAEARRYGFHGTLKPPFRLAEGASEAALLQQAAHFAAARSRFGVPPLTLQNLSGFLALRPVSCSDALDRLAADCVRDFDAFRAPTSAAELARRQAAGLTAQQNAMLLAWGYPYVLDEFRFHMTLTCRLKDGERTLMAQVLRPLVSGFAEQALTIDAITILVEPPGGCFRELRRFPLMA